MNKVYLLDTHIWLWINTDLERLRSDIRDLLANRDNELYLSVASVWEIVVKYTLGKLPLPEHPTSYIPSRQKLTGVRPLPIEQSHVLEVGNLPAHHADPFDRLIVAQARKDNMVLVTADATLAQYECDILLNS